MTTTDKQKIKELFQAKCEKLGYSQERGATAAGTKGTTVSQVFAGKYPANDDAIYKLLAIWVDFKNKSWATAETVNLKLITKLLEDAKENANVYAIIGPAGCGKTHAQTLFAENNPNAFLLGCAEYWNRKEFLKELLTQMGRDHGGLTVAEMMKDVIKTILAMDNPIIMMDEADKLSDQVLYFFITLYNKLEDHCGLVMSATEHLKLRLQRGVDRNRKGYSEIWSRIGKKPAMCVAVKPKDVKAICAANGLDDDGEIANIVQEAEGDLRRVKKSIHRTKKAQEA